MNKWNEYDHLNLRLALQNKTDSLIAYWRFMRKKAERKKAESNATGEKSNATGEKFGFAVLFAEKEEKEKENELIKLIAKATLALRKAEIEANNLQLRIEMLKRLKKGLEHQTGLKKGLEHQNQTDLKKGLEHQTKQI